MNIVEIHELNNWKVTLFDNSVVWIESVYTTRLNKRYAFYYGIELPQLPKYVLDMVYQMFDSHRDIVRLPLWQRIPQRGLIPLPVSYSRYMSCENAGLWYKPWSKQGRKVK